MVPVPEEGFRDQEYFALEFLTLKSWVCEGFNVTVAGEIVWACKAAAAKKRKRDVSKSVNIDFMVIVTSNSQIGTRLVLRHRQIHLVVLCFPRSLRLRSACFRLSSVGSKH